MNELNNTNLRVQLTLRTTSPTVFFHKFSIFLAFAFFSPKWAFVWMFVDARCCKWIGKEQFQSPKINQSINRLVDQSINRSIE